MAKSILHITDLHLNKFDGTDEHLRKRYYREYIDSLVNCITESQQSVNIIVASGDFIDKGKTENFSHIIEIINYLSDGLEVERNNVCLCIGNHDFKYKKESFDGRNSIDIRKPFYEFSANFDKNIIEKNDRAVLKKLDDNILFLSIDSTLGSHTEKRQGKPGEITNEEIDILVNDLVKMHVNEGDVLLIGCHYPIEVFPNSLGGVGEESWSENHVWRQAGFLRTRINNLPNILKVWFMGDTHFPDHLYYENAIFLMTGKFGGTTELTDPKFVSHIDRQCKIITLENEDVKHVITYNYKMVTHEDSPMYGVWSHEISEIRKINSHNPKKPGTDQIDMEKGASSRIDKISETVEEQIIERIKEFDLYSFGRFKTSNDHTSLGWISINQLLNEQKILSSIVSKSVSRIKDKVDTTADQTAIIGLDFWGAIIGSQVSVRTGIKHYCMATRGHGQYHSALEIKNTLLEGDIKSLKCIVMFIDVISSGGTVNKTLDSIKKLNTKINFHLISVISNNKELNEKVSNVLSTIGSFCLDLKIPVINNAELPDEHILPPNIDFSIKSE